MQWLNVIRSNENAINNALAEIPAIYKNYKHPCVCVAYAPLMIGNAKQYFYMEYFDPDLMLSKWLISEKLFKVMKPSKIMRS